MADVARSIADAFEARLARLHEDARLITLHRERAFLQTLNFSEEELDVYRARIDGVTDRFAKLT